MAAVLGHRVGVEGFLGVERVARGTGWGGACRVHNDWIAGRGQGAAPWENPCVILRVLFSRKKPSTAAAARGGKSVAQGSDLPTHMHTGGVLGLREITSGVFFLHLLTLGN